MLKNNNITKTIICLIAICLVILTAKISLAANNDYLDKLNELPTENAEKIQEGNKPENNIQNLNTNTEKNGDLDNNNQKNENTNVNENTPTETPYAGLGDNSSIIFIVIFAVSAIYAYKKVKDYNI